MRTVRRMIHADVLASVGFVTLAFLTLFFFFDFVDELRSVNAAGGYPLKYAVLVVLLESPARLYDLLPITVLIGTIFVMARMAQSSEFTILRTSGLGPWRALRVLVTLGLLFVLLTFAVGDYMAPAADRASQLLRSRYLGQVTVGQTGAWLKEKRAGDSYAVNVGALLPDGSMRGIRIIEFDDQGRMAATIQADSGRFAKDGGWLLAGVSETELETDSGAPLASSAQAPRIVRTSEATLDWPSTITPEMVSVALLQPERMPTWDLFQYIRHLEANGQSSQRYQIQFWKKVFYPLSCLVMVVLALPFAYLHFRAGGISTYVFIGVMTGISFFLLNNLFGHFGNLQNWRPWLAAAAPGIIYSLLSLAAFGWLVLRR